MRTILATGVAHLSFPGGGVFLPARNPHDRQLLTINLVHHVHAVGQAQVLLNEQRWLISVQRDGEAQRCAVCGAVSEVVCKAPSIEGSSFCAPCAFSDRVKALTGAGLAPLDVSQVAVNAVAVRHGPRHGSRAWGVTRSPAPQAGRPLAPPPASADAGHVRRRAVTVR